jgi:T-complex protein 1 subunit alpha
MDGTRQQGDDVRTQNVTAVCAVANVIKSSYGPQGLDKMMVSAAGDVSVTNDGATILKLLDVEHPAAKIMVQLSHQQDVAVGDGTSSVVIIAAEILKRADRLVKQKIHPTSIMAGLRIACREAVKYIKDVLSISVKELDRKFLLQVAATSMSSKIIGASGMDHFAGLCVDAMLAVKQTDSKGRPLYPVSSVNVLKAHGKSALESEVIKGYALNCTKAAQGMPYLIKGAKIALLDINLHKAKMDMGVQVVISDPEKLAEVRKREEDMVKERVKMILAAGANVVLTTKGIDDLTLKYFVEAGAMGVRRCRKEDLRSIARATGATLIGTFADLEGNESFDKSLMGTCEEVEQIKIADEELIVLRGLPLQGASSVILRGANTLMLDEEERSLHDAMCVVKRVLESGKVVAGGGAVEAALSVYLEDFAKTMGSREQLAVAEFAAALLVVPKTLAANGAHDAVDLVAQLRAAHYEVQTSDSSKQRFTAGMDLDKGVIRDNLEAGIIEPALCKIKMLKAATEGAVQLLRIDDMIRLNPKKPQQDPHGH